MLAAVWAFLKTAFAWVSNNIKLVAIIAALVTAGILVIIWRRKNSMIKQLRAELFLAKAKLEIAELARKYQVLLSRFAEVRKQDQVLDSKLNEIEQRLVSEVDPDMTAEQIAAKFREIGVKP